MKFIDTNVLVYAADSRNPYKRELARRFLTSAVMSGGYAVNVQVLNEFASVAFRKLKLNAEEVLAYLEMFRVFKVYPMSSDLTERGIAIMRRFDLQFYDSLLLAAAQTNGCTEFYSEDLNDGQIYCGMKAVNPFKEKDLS